MTPIWTVYCHIHVESGRRYIGQTKKTWKQRWNRHVFEAKHVKSGYGYFHNAIRKYGKDTFEHEVLETCHDLKSANAAEQKWIIHFRSNEPKFGFNLTRGGAHTPHPVKNPWNRPEFREKGLANIARVNANLTPVKRSGHSRALWNRPEFRSAVTAGVKASWRDPGYQIKMSKISREVNSRPEVKKMISDALTGRPISQDRRDRLAELKRGTKRSPEVAAKLAAIQASAEYLENQRLTHLGKKTSASTKRKIAASSKSSDPKMRARIAASVRAYHERRRASLMFEVAS